MTLYFSKVHEVVAAPVERQTASVWLSSSRCSTRGKVCYVRLPCIFWHMATFPACIMRSKLSSHLNRYHHLLIVKFIMNVMLPLEMCKSCNSINVYMIRYRIHVHHVEEQHDCTSARWMSLTKTENGAGVWLVAAPVQVILTSAHGGRVFLLPSRPSALAIFFHRASSTADICRLLVGTLISIVTRLLLWDVLVVV